MLEHAAKLMAEKIARELFRLSQAYGQSLGSSFDDLLHDFTLMIQHDDLEDVRMVLHDTQRRTLLEYAYHIRARKVESSVPQDHVDGLAVVAACRTFFYEPAHFSQRQCSRLRGAVAHSLESSADLYP